MDDGTAFLGALLLGLIAFAAGWDIGDSRGRSDIVKHCETAGVFMVGNKAIACAPKGVYEGTK